MQELSGDRNAESDIPVMSTSRWLALSDVGGCESFGCVVELSLTAKTFLAIVPLFMLCSTMLEKSHEIFRE